MAFVGRTDVKDPGAGQHQWERLAQRRERLYAEDAQFSAARPDDAVAESVVSRDRGSPKPWQP